MFLFNESNLKYLLVVIILDFFTGIFKAFIEHKINSSASLKGILKKNKLFFHYSIDYNIGTNSRIRQRFKKYDNHISNN